MNCHASSRPAPVRSLTRSSGQSALDNAVHQMMAAVSLPPPPGGSFQPTVPIRFDIANQTSRYDVTIDGSVLICQRARICRSIAA